MKKDHIQSRSTDMYHLDFGCTASRFAYDDAQDYQQIYCEKDLKDLWRILKKRQRSYERYFQSSLLQRECSEASKFHIFLKLFDDPNKNWKVNDHCHYKELHQ